MAAAGDVAGRSLPFQRTAGDSASTSDGQATVSLLDAATPEAPVALEIRFAVQLLVAPLVVVPDPPPDHVVVPMQRSSDIYPSPTLDDLSRPINWVPTSTVQEDWGSYQIVVSGVDVTFFRNMATQLGQMVMNEPFGDDTVDLIFPQVTPWDEPGSGDLTWLVLGAPIEIYQVLPDGSADTANPMFEGRYASEEDTLGPRTTGTGQGGEQGTERQASFMVAHCLGAIYCADLQIKTPVFVTQVATDRTTGNLVAAPTDIGTLISNEMNTRSQTNRTVQLGYCTPVITGVVVSDKGSGTQLVNGYLQDLLAQGAVSPVPTPGSNVTGIALRPDRGGYWLVADDSSVLVFGARTFYGGSEVGTTLNALFSGICASPSGLGYAICAEDGGVFCYGDFPSEGSLPGIPVAPTGSVVGIAATPTGRGYWMVDQAGNVYPFGNAVSHGFGPGSSDIVDIKATPTGLGYFLLDSTGHVYAYGDASYQGGASGTGQTFVAVAVVSATEYWLVDSLGDAFGYNLPTFSVGEALAAPISAAAANDAGGLTLTALDGGVFALGDAQYHGSVPGEDGEWEEWTIRKAPGRVPVIALKDRWTQHATMRVGQPGIQLGTLLKDATTSRNAIYGEGTTPAAVNPDGTPTGGHTWRNSKYPNLRPNLDPPLFSGLVLSLGVTDSTVVTWAQAMRDAGWPVDVDKAGNISSTFGGQDRNTCRAFQAANGLTISGEVGAQTWAATFVSSTFSTSSLNALTGAYIAPLAERAFVEPFLYDRYGAVMQTPEGGPMANPVFDPTVLRVEGWEEFGAGVDKTTGEASALAELMRDGTPGYIGEITLYADPNEMSRYDLRPGMNLCLQDFRGTGDAGVFLHIAQVNIQWNTAGRPVVITVDEHAQDLVTIATMRTADRSTTDPVRRTRHNRRASRIIPDRTSQFDIEAGGGAIPTFVLQAASWSVVRIAASAAGSIIEVAAATISPPTPFSMGVFNMPISPIQLLGLMPDGPLADGGGGASEWAANANALDALGLVIAWGQIGDACGYSPGSQSNGDPLTGVFEDQGAWQYQSTLPPWLWVAIWAESQCMFTGVPGTTGAQLYPEPVWGM